MRIDDNGYPTYVTERGGSGVAIIQGRSKVKLSTVEAKALLQVLADMPSVGGHRKDGLEDG
jgi:hypothetical protein